MTTLTKDQIDQIVNLAELDDNSATSTYSGRGMYGDQCVGFTVDSTREILALGAALVSVVGDDLPDMLYNAQTDSMGRGSIVYFPGTTCGEPVGGDLDDDLDDDEDY